MIGQDGRVQIHRDDGRYGDGLLTLHDWHHRTVASAAVRLRSEIDHKGRGRVLRTTKDRYLLLLARILDFRAMSDIELLTISVMGNASCRVRIYRQFLFF